MKDANGIPCSQKCPTSMDNIYSWILLSCWRQRRDFRNPNKCLLLKITLVRHIFWTPSLLWTVWHITFLFLVIALPFLYFCYSPAKHSLYLASFSFQISMVWRRLTVPSSPSCLFALHSRPLRHVCLPLLFFIMNAKVSNKDFLSHQFSYFFLKIINGDLSCQRLSFKKAQECLLIFLLFPLIWSWKPGTLTVLLPTVILRVFHCHLTCWLFINLDIFFNEHVKLKIRKEHIGFSLWPFWPSYLPTVSPVQPEGLWAAASPSTSGLETINAGLTWRQHSSECALLFTQVVTHHLEADNNSSIYQAR